jgi:putative SOS response-associated peptidase YedK
MCGRFTITVTIGFSRRFGVAESSVTIEPRYNIAPSQQVPVIIPGHEEGSPRLLTSMSWGLVPSWTKEPKFGHFINARAENLLEKKFFRDAALHRRCLIPATGFYEWKHDCGKKIPYYIRRKDGALFAFAGIYEAWQAPGQEPVLTCAIITTGPDSVVAPFHNRMPAILEETMEDTWISAPAWQPADLGSLLAPYPSGLLEAYQVSPAVNSTSADGPDLIKSVGQETLF